MVYVQSARMASSLTAKAYAVNASEDAINALYPRYALSVQPTSTCLQTVTKVSPVLIAQITDMLRPAQQMDSESALNALKTANYAIPTNFA